MKNILIILTTLFFGIPFSKAQVCTPNSSLVTPGIIPAVLNVAELNKNYSETITIQLFRDTSTLFGSTKVPVRIDSMRMLTIVGMPNGLTSNCLAPNCRFLPLQNTCIQLSGVPTTLGTFPLKIVVRTWAKTGSFLLPPQVDTIRNFSITVTDNISTNKIEVNTSKLIPNPTQNIAIITNPLPKVNTYLFDLSGKIVPCIIEKQNQCLTLQLHSLQNGMYMVKHGKQSFVLIKN